MGDTCTESTTLTVTTTSDHDGTAVVRVTGEIDLACEESVRAAIVAQLGRRPAALVLDFTEVEFFGSTGLQLVVDAYGSATRLGLGFAVATDRRAVLRPLEITLVRETVDVHPTVRDALSAVRTAGGMSAAHR
ncbi:STAS domain-containing protein [Actinosynnema sp. NPDC059335]|uniref:STAS domain-containing protein n=1 Tax=Actinosynnema sp. NPDC059335 TaxID=3346804 RepID=UPI0036702B9C